MARLFTAASSQYLTRASARVTAAPLTIATFFKPNDVTGTYVLATVGAASSVLNRFSLVILGSVNDTVLFQATDGATDRNALTTTTYQANVWQHACGVAVSATDRRVFLNGGSKGTETTSCVPTGINATRIGASLASTPANFLDGAMAHTAIWNVALSDAEVASLAAGTNPTMIRPQNLIEYYPMGLGSPEYSLMGSNQLTLVGTSTVAPDAFIIQSPFPWQDQDFENTRLPSAGARLFGADTDRISLGSPSGLDDLFQTGQMMLVATGRRYAVPSFAVIAAKGGATGGWVWDIIGPPNEGKMLFNVDRSVTDTQVFCDTPMPAGQPTCFGVNWDATAASGVGGVTFYGNFLQYPVTLLTGTAVGSPSGTFVSDASGDQNVGNHSTTVGPFKGDLGWFVQKWKSGSTPWSLDEFQQVQHGILVCKACREAGVSIAPGLAIINQSGAAKVILEIHADGSAPTDHSANAFTATLTGTLQGQEQVGYHHLKTGDWTADAEPGHPDGVPSLVLYPYTSEYAMVDFQTDATEMSAWARSTIGPIFGDPRVSNFGYSVDGVFGGQFVGTSLYIYGLATGLSPTSKTVTLINGMRASADGIRPFWGTFANLVWFNAPAVKQAPTVYTKPLVMVVDSLFDGFYSNPPTQLSALQLIRGDLNPSFYDGVVFDGAGALSLFAIGANATLRQKMVDTIAALNPRAIFSNLAGNDWVNAYFGPVATFQTNYDDWVTRLKASTSPDVPIMMGGLPDFPAGSPHSGANSAGDTIPNYRTAIQNVVNAKGGRVSYIPLTSVISTSTGFDADLKHPNNAGSSQLANFMLSQIDRLVLVINDTLHAHSADGLALTQKALLTLADSSHGHLADSPVLTQKNTVVVADALHVNSVDNVVLTPNAPPILVVGDTLHAHSADNLILTATSPLVISDALHAHSADLISLLQKNVLGVFDSLHLHRSGMVTFIIPQPIVFHRLSLKTVQNIRVVPRSKREEV